MRKIVSVLLSLLMVISCMTCMLVSPAGTASAAQPYVTFEQDSQSLLQNIPSEWQSESQNCQDRTKFTVSSDSKLGGNSMERTGDAMYQGYYIPVTLGAGRSYTLDFYLKTTVEVQVVKVIKGATYKTVNGQAQNYSTIKEIAIETPDADGWAHYNATFTPTESGEHHIYIHFGNKTDDTNCFTVSDLTLKCHNVVMGAEVQGNGAVSATAGDGYVTFNATPYQNSGFIGWFDGESVLSISRTYTYNYDSVNDYTVTAKFTDDNLVADYDYSDWKQWWPQGKSHATTTLDSVNSVFGGNAAEVKSPSYQFRYILVELGANSKYDFELYVDKTPGESIVVEKWRIFRLSEANTEVTDSSLFAPVSEEDGRTFFVDKYYGENYSTLTIEEPTKLSVSFTTAAADTYVIGVKFYACSGNCTLSDWSLVNSTTYDVSAVAEGNGAATASKVVSGKSTFTATPYLDSEFLGWYNGDTLVSEELSFTQTITANTTLTARFSDENLLAGKNVANPQQTSETENTTDGTIYSAVTDTEGWWSNGWPQGKYAASTDSHLGGASITNPSMGHQAHVYTMLLKPNTQYSVEFSVKATNKVRRLWLLTNDALFGYTNTDDGKGTGGKWSSAPGTHAIDWINDKDTDLSEWTRYSHTFTTNDSDAEVIPYYLYADFTEDQIVTSAYTPGIYFSDLSLVDLTTIDVTATATGNGYTVVKTSGTSATLTAHPYANGGQFLGWYDNQGKLVTTESVFTLENVTQSAAYTAKFTKVNLAADYNYVASDYKSTGLYTTAGDGWKKSPTSWVDINNANDESCFGGSAIKLTGTVQFQTIYLPLTLKANTKYSIAFNYFTQNVSTGTIAIYKSDLNLHDGEEGEKTGAGGQYSSGTELVGNSNWTQTAVEGTKFTTYSTTFTTDATGNTSDNYYVYIHFDDKSDTPSAILSDLSLIEVDGADLLDYAEFKGNAIRTTGTQALRFKYDIASDIYSAGYYGYTVKEIGALAIRTDYLDGSALKLGSVYNYNGEEKTAGQAVIPAEALVSEPTIALTNIGVTKDSTGLNATTDYTVYGEEYTVRIYMILELEGRELTLYAEERTASVFAVMEEILTSTETDAGTEADKQAINTLLDLTTDADAGTTLKTYYTAWKEQ